MEIKYVAPLDYVEIRRQASALRADVMRRGIRWLFQSFKNLTMKRLSQTLPMKSTVKS